ncbi:hypothetical protein Tco_0814836 [Tanacetum coccineum]
MNELRVRIKGLEVKSAEELSLMMSRKKSFRLRLQETEEDKVDEAKDDEHQRSLQEKKTDSRKGNAYTYGMDGPEDKLEKGFWKCLRIMFEEPLSTDSIWSEIGQQKIYLYCYEFTMSNQHKDWLVLRANGSWCQRIGTSPEQTATSKALNPLMAVNVCKNHMVFQLTNVSSTDFTISVDVPEIFMQQFRYSIKKVQGTDSYEFLLANKKCVVNADVIRMILDICPRVEGVNFTDVPDDDTTLTLLIKLGYKGPLYKHTNMFMDHMHQPWRTLAAIINTCLSRKTASNDKLYSPKKSKGKGLQRKKTADDSQETVDVSKESEHEPESVKRKTSSKRRVKKKVTLSVDDNIISDDPDTALEIVTEFVPKPTKRIKSGKVTSNPPKKLKGTPSPEEQEAADIMQALKESKKTSKRQPGTGTKLGVPDEKKEITKENGILEWGSKQEREYSEEDKHDDEENDNKEGDADDEANETESDEYDIYKYKIHVRKDDKEMLNAKVDNSDKGDEEVTDAAKADAEKSSKVKDDPKKTDMCENTYLFYSQTGP